MNVELLNALKDRSHMSIKEIEEKSGVSSSTISRILHGQTDSPGAQTLSDIVTAMGGSAEDLAEIVWECPAEHDGRPVSHDDLQALIDLYERAIAGKNRWIKMLFTVCCVLLISMVVIIFYFIWDATHEAAGMIRY